MLGDATNSGVRSYYSPAARSRGAGLAPLVHFPGAPFSEDSTPVSRTRFVLALIMLPAMLSAQSSASLKQAVSSITPADIQRRIGILADDSMLGRATPSPQLEQTAAYVAAEFKRFGLRPGGDSGGYLQRYPITLRQLDTTHSTLTVTTASGPTTLHLGVDVFLLFRPSLTPVSGPVLLFTGPGDTLHPLAGADVKGAWIAVIGTADSNGVNINDPAIPAGLSAGAVGVLLITNRPDAQWQNRLGRLRTPIATLGNAAADTSKRPALVEFRDATAARILALDIPSLRAQTTRAFRRLDGVTLAYAPVYITGRGTSAPNTIGILEGSDPKLKDEYVFFTGHMDHIGTPGAGEFCAARGADSICNGADDDASGTVAVIEAARAFSQLSPRPKRSLVFMTVSGEERGLWGSTWFTDHPTVPLSNVVADLNTDMVGRNWKDTIVVIGKEHSDLGATMNRVGRAHPELRMQPIDDIWPQESFYTRSDHYNFARKGVPILFFFNGTHADYHQVSDSPDKIDSEKESRIVKLVFYLGLEVANTTQRPRWNPESYKKIVETR